ncbi:hypothetical protein SDC9_161665 [bioreactor metagenome]|uniref:Uncharacterized protein n=1 Tax=bioreactor metagenome TaxID=1076179 RepID=A0A645FIW2_9ZZZZ
MVGASIRGMPLQMFEDMTIGQIVDYCITYNNMQDEEKDEDSPRIRKATQEDFDRL